MGRLWRAIKSLLKWIFVPIWGPFWVLQWVGSRLAKPAKKFVKTWAPVVLAGAVILLAVAIIVGGVWLYSITRPAPVMPTRIIQGQYEFTGQDPVVETFEQAYIEGGDDGSTEPTCPKFVSYSKPGGEFETWELVDGTCVYAD